MRVLIEKDAVNYIAKMALVLHDSGKKKLVTLHKITDDQLGAPQPVDPGRFGEFLALAGLREKAGCCFIPDKLVAIGDDAIAWFVPAERREMFYKRQGLLELNGKALPNPALVFLAAAGSLSVFALAENRRPGPETPLYRAPFLNVYDNGRICMPSGHRGTTSDLNRIPEYENAFFNSFGSHLNGGECTAYPGGHDALWQHIFKTGVETFDPAWLKPMGKQLREVIR